MTHVAPRLASSRRARLLGASALALASLVTLGAGCAEERPPINRVQADALPKSFFVGEDLQSSADDPEFYAQGTLTDVGYGASQDGLFTSTYAQPLSRLKWVITEDYLIGRITYERIEDSDGRGAAGAQSSDGVIAAMYKIRSHFDIVKAYNSTTGEPLNILEENTSDRAWYERAYFRVDWSKNLAVDTYDFDTLSLIGVYGGVEYEPMEYYVNDPDDPNSPVFDLDNGYFDVTFKAFAKPQQVDLSMFDWGIPSFPACFLDNDFLGGSAPSGSCNPAELTIRQSFRKIVPTDYEPVHWDGYRFQANGAFTTDRYGYARNYGMSDDKWYRFVARYNIWERSHYYTDPVAMTGAVACFTPETTPFGLDPHRDTNGDGVEDECEAVGQGSHCDTFSQKCTLPYRDRTPKPVVWYYANDSDPFYFEPTEWAIHEWDVAMRATVRSTQYAECVKAGDSDCTTKYPMWFGQQDENKDAIDLAREVDDCRHGRAYLDKNRDEAACTALADTIGAERGYSPGVISVAKMPEMVILCHSPVEAGDPAACGSPRLPEGVTAEQCGARDASAELVATCREALNVRRGDLRYHQINVIHEPQSQSPWGIMTNSHDPLTGECVAASVNVWASDTDLWTQKLVDMSRYIGGELKDADITEGKNIRDWAAASAAADGGMMPRMNKEEVDERLASFVNATPEAMHDNQPLPNSAITKQARAIKEQVRGVRAKLGAPQMNAPRYAARRDLAKNTPIEASLITGMVQAMYGATGLPLSDALMNIISPLRGGNPSIQRDIYQMKQLALAERGACVLNEAPAPTGMPVLANMLQKKFGAFDPTQSKAEQQARAEKMRQYLAKRAHYAVIAHEMGHSFGERHNFISSADAWDYRPQYWQLRTRNGKVTKDCTDLVKDGKSCIGPRYFDPVTQEEDDNMIWTWMQSTVMDYPGEATQDMMGLGVWDFAAPKAFYGDVVAVHADPSYKSTTPRGQGMLYITDDFGGILGLEFQTGVGDAAVPIHYSALNREFELIHGCYDVDPQMYKPASWDEAELGVWDPVFDGRIVKVDGQYSRCKTQPVDYVFWSDLRFPTAAEAGDYYRGGPAVDATGRTRLPYGFATDSWADLGNLSVYRSDNGADPYELFDFLTTQQEVNHIFDNYRRRRQDFSVKSAANRGLVRYDEKLRDAAKGLGLYANIYRYVARDQGLDFNTFWPVYAPYWFKEQIIASGLGFDHFARLAARPASGDHYLPPGDTVLRSSEDTWGTATAARVTVPNGATGYFGRITAGGRPLENKLSDYNGEYDSEYTINAGSYYDKLWTAMLFTESVDNFISSSRSDFYDARYRSVSMADLFPDGYRRWLANNLTGDDGIKGPRVEADASGLPLVDAKNWPMGPIGWTQWWTKDVQSCFPAANSNVCTIYGAVDSDPLDAEAPANTATLDPQVGWEQQKFFIAWTLIYLPENQQQWWLDMLRIWELGADNDPGIDARIEFHNPTGRTYVARTFGKETIFGERVQKGIAARVLEYANGLLVQAYETDPGPDLDGDGEPDWYLPRLGDTGQPIVKWDPTVKQINSNGGEVSGRPGCNQNDNSTCTCAANRACITLEDYMTVPAYLRQSLATFGYAAFDRKGIY